MNWLKKGPELKKPDLKVPDLNVPTVISDVFYDLRDRRLLPLVALVVVAIVAVPFLLGDPAEPVPPPVADGTSAAEGEASASKLTVVEATPGLRDYRKRLQRRSPSNPFEQRYTEANLKGAKLNPLPEGGSESTGGSGGSSEKASKVDSDGGTTDDAKSNGEGSAAEPKLTVLAWSIDVRIVRSGGNNPEARQKSLMSKPVVKHDVLPQTPLPGEKTPIVIYMGPAREGTGVTGRALLLVSPSVKSVFGDIPCASGEEACQLLEVEPGLPVSFVYGPNDVHYTITVQKIEPVEAGTG